MHTFRILVVDDEEDIVEFLSYNLKKEGYKTAFYGKYHVGDIDGSYPHQNGYDETLFTIYNQFGSQFFNKDGEDTGATIGFTEAQQDQLYTLDKEFRNPATIPWSAEAKAGGKARQFNKDYSYEEQRDSNPENSN